MPPHTLNPGASGSDPTSMDEARRRAEETHRMMATELDLHGLGLITLPEEITKSKRLTTLDLDFNNLNMLPEWIGSLEGLQEIRLNNNQITALPEPLRYLRKMERLYLNNNRLTELPEWLGRLGKLQILSLNQNRLVTLPASTRYLNELHVLYFGGNQLTVVPEPVRELTELQQLNLHSNNLGELPYWIEEFTKLEVLDLDYNHLTRLPKQIDKLRALRTLYLRGNLFRTFPESVRSLPELQTLHLESNHLSELPEWLRDLKKLQILDLENNRLTQLPGWLGELPELQTLNLSGNRLTVLPKDMGRSFTSLRQLYLQNNQLTALPDSIRNLKLQSLNVSNNLLSPDMLTPSGSGDESGEGKKPYAPIRLLHLSDLHFTAETPVPARLQWLLNDIQQEKRDGGLGFKELDYLVISGDFTDKGSAKGFEKAYEFISELMQEFRLSTEQCIFVPGNHDVTDRHDAYEWRENSEGLTPGEFVRKDDIVLARVREKYHLRFKPFEEFYDRLFPLRPYPEKYEEQGISVPFWQTGLQFLALNSCWQIDQFYRKRSGLLPDSVARVIKDARAQEDSARKSGELEEDKRLLRIAVWHHAVTGSDQMQNSEFLDHLRKYGVRIVLHGDVHVMRREVIGYSPGKQIHVAGSGSFGARATDRAESVPRLYNVLEIARDLKSMRVHTREQRTADGEWKGWYEWDNPAGADNRLSYYDVEL